MKYEPKVFPTSEEEVEAEARRYDMLWGDCPSSPFVEQDPSVSRTWIHLLATALTAIVVGYLGYFLWKLLV